ncbi:MAG: hypothetical protein EOO73_22585 [Myxococcales bacterium]|nr:MAG: hypothetical protein EOO73_22585 [Myxococcales bacterium]
MGFFGRLLGIEDESNRAQTRGASAQPPGAARPGVGAEPTDAQAVERYRYMLRTAPPETVEQAHAEAFAKLTPEQRRMVLSQLTEAAPAAERASVAATSPDDPQALARVATRAEVRQPGLMERTLGGGMGLGASLMSSFAMGFVGSMVAQSFMSAIGGFGGDDASADAGADTDGQSDAVAENDPDAGADDYADDGMDGGGDFGGDFDV